MNPSVLVALAIFFAVSGLTVMIGQINYANGYCAAKCEDDHFIKASICFCTDGDQKVTSQYKIP